MAILKLLTSASRSRISRSSCATVVPVVNVIGTAPPDRVSVPPVSKANRSGVGCAARTFRVGPEDDALDDDDLVGGAAEAALPLVPGAGFLSLPEQAAARAKTTSRPAAKFTFHMAPGAIRPPPPP